MFSICRQTVAATGIEFAIKCKFFNSLEENLVVGGANVLKVYRIIPEIEINSKEKYSGECSIHLVERFINENLFRYATTQHENGMSCIL